MMWLAAVLLIIFLAGVVCGAAGIIDPLGRRQ